MFTVLSSWQSHCKSSPGSSDECRTATSGRRPKTKPDDLGCESDCTCFQKLYPPSPFIIITQPESWYSFYCPTEGRRLSRPSWLVTYRDGLPVHRRSPILVLTGSDVAQLCWSRPTRYHMWLAHMNNRPQGPGFETWNFAADGHTANAHCSPVEKLTEVRRQASIEAYVRSVFCRQSSLTDDWSVLM